MGFPFAVDWLKYWITQNPQFDWTGMTPAAYERYWDQSGEEYGLVIGTDNPDLSAFRDRGGKAIIWHGWADQLDFRRRHDRLLQEVAKADGRRRQGFAVCTPSHGSRRGSLRWRRRSKSLRSAGRPAFVGGRQQGPGDPDGRTPRPDRCNHPIEAAVPVSAGREVQGDREHGRRGELHMQRRVLG